MLAFPLRLHRVLCALICVLKSSTTNRQFFSASPRSFQYLMVLLLPLPFMVSAEDINQYQETRKVVVLDDGSAGAGVVSFLFGRNYNHEAFRLIEQSRIYEASSLSLEHGGITDKSAQLVASLLKKDDCGFNCQSSFFLGATAGNRADKENAKEVFEEVRKKLKQFGVDENEYDIEMKVLDGSMKGAYSWLGVNYIYGKPDNSEASYGIVELGGKSAQMVFNLKSEKDSDDHVVLKNKVFEPGKEDKAFLTLERDLDQKTVSKVIAESKIGFGLEQAYKEYEKKFKDTGVHPCKMRDENAAVNYVECSQVMNSLFSKEDDEHRHGKRLFWQPDEGTIEWRMPETYYLSGYFYDFTVHMGLRSHLTLGQLESAAQYACENFSESDLKTALSIGAVDTYKSTDLFGEFEATLPPVKTSPVITKAYDFPYSGSGSFQQLKTESFCGTLTYMVSLLKHFGIQKNHNLVIAKSLVQGTPPHPANWIPGCAYARANEYKINNKTSINTLHPEKKGSSGITVGKNEQI